MNKFFAWGVLAAMSAGPTPAQAAVHALVMGFDAYSPKVSLEGSRNDAADIAGVLRKRGVADVTVISEPGTTRDTVERAWAAMVARAAPGDVLFVSFSGHGNRSPEKGEPKHTPDGFEKGFLLPSYDEDQHPEEQLRDEHLYDLFKAVSDQGFKVVFVADACHSGATVRGVPGSPAVPKFQVFQLHGKAPPPAPAAAAVVHRPPISGLTIYSAADEHQTIQEFTLDGQRRGALSFVLARGLDGAAAEPNGRLTEGDLGRYVVANVRLRSNNTQIPSAVTPDPDMPIFDGGAPPQKPTFPALPSVALFTDRDSPPSVTGVTRADKQADAVVSWLGQSRVLNAHGDVVASAVEANRLQDAVDARRVLEALTQAVGQSGSALETSVAAKGKPPSDRYYLPNEDIRIEAQATPLRFLTVVDLTADGTVQFLWPLKGDPLEWKAAERPNFKVHVVAPFGQDTLIFIESDRALTELHGELARLDGQIAPLPFYDSLKLWLPQVTFKLGIQSVFTCAALREDGVCG